MYKILDINSWSRREQYLFFKDYDNPFFNICVEVDITDLMRFTKEKNISFFIASLYASQKAVNDVEEFRYRIKNDRVIMYDRIHCGSTVLNENETFSFCYFDFHDSFDRFKSEMTSVLQRNSEGKEPLDARADDDNMIHYSVIPWIAFTGLSHSRRFGREDSIPKIVFGKYQTKNGRLMMPISVEVHHSLMDALHVSKYLTRLQEILDQPEVELAK